MFLNFLFNSLSTALLSTIIALILGSLAAYAIQRSGAKIVNFVSGSGLVFKNDTYFKYRGAYL